MSAEAVRAAFDAKDWEALRLQLHPYLRWTDRAGVVTRGRNNVLALLAAADELSPPRSIELRDGQVYRWFA